MPSYTLQCGHRHDLTDCITRASSLDNSRAVCHVCKTPFSPAEGAYLELCDTTKMTLAEFIRSDQEYVDRRTAELKANPPPALMPRCSGTCKNGKACTKVAMRSSGVYCNLHLPK